VVLERLEVLIEEAPQPLIGDFWPADEFERMVGENRLNKGRRSVPRPKHSLYPIADPMGDSAAGEF